MRANVSKLFCGHGLVLRIYKKFSQLNNKVTNNPMKKWAIYLNRYFFNKSIKMADKNMKNAQYN